MHSRHCQICGNTNNSEPFDTNGSVSSDGFFQPFSISLAACGSCGNTYIVQDAAMRENLKKFYLQDYAFLLGSREEEPCEITDEAFLPYSDRLVSFISPLVNEKLHKNILDVGAGKGNFLSAFHKRFPNIEKHAIEPSPAFKHLSTIPFLKSCQNAFFDSSLYKERFDLLSLIGVLEHVFSPVAFLTNIKNVLRGPESLVLVEVPNFKNNKSDLIAFDHLFKYTECSFENILRLCGFSIVARDVNQKRVPMDFIIKPDVIRSTSTCSGSEPFSEADLYMQSAISEAKKLSTRPIAIYGQGLILAYFLGNRIFEEENLICIIDDNPLYQGTLYKKKIPIVSLDEYFHNFMRKTEGIFLAMNDCYHEAVLSKLKSKNISIPIAGKWEQH